MANYLNIKDRSNSAFNHKKQTPLHTGFSLIEVLITATVGLVLGAGVLKLSQVAIQNTNIVQTSLVESELKRALDKFLNDPDNPTQCQDVLGPFHASDLSASPVSVYPQNPVPTADPAKTAYEKLGKLAGETGLISIEKIELKDNSDPERQFIVYYKKPRLGKYATIGGGKCTGGTAAGDQNGCYFVSCDIKYRCSSSACNDADGADNTAGTADDDITCELVAGSCEGNNQRSNTIANKECDPGLSLTGFDSAGEPICQISCSAGRVYDESTGNCKCPGGPGELRWTVSADGSGGSCGCVDETKAWNGKKCVTMCTGINKFNTRTKRCTECDNSGTYGIDKDYHWNASANECVYCPERRASAGAPRQTMYFTPGSDPDRVSTCGCPSIGDRYISFQKDFPGLGAACVDKCEANQKWNNLTENCEQKCPAGQRWFQGSPDYCQSCPGEWKPYNKAAKYSQGFITGCKCPTGKKWCGTTGGRWDCLERCNEWGHVWNSTSETCVDRCPGKVWNGKRCVTKCAVDGEGRDRSSSACRRCEDIPAEDGVSWIEAHSHRGEITGDCIPSNTSDPQPGKTCYCDWPENDFAKRCPSSQQP